MWSQWWSAWRLSAATSSPTFVIDPFVGIHLRPHQRAGVKFMYECVTGLRHGCISDSTHRGCLLAHEMGMGKTMVAIEMITQVLVHHPRPRLLVCAPSNKAVRVVLARLLLAHPHSVVGLAEVFPGQVGEHVARGRDRESAQEGL